MKAYLYNKNTAVMSCEVENGHITKVYQIANKDLLPIPLTYNLSLENINSWLTGRSIPEKRDGIKEARIMFPHFENLHNMFSLSDQYWFRFNKKETWDALNFFTNDYQTEVGKIFFTPWNVNQDELKKPSPDLTTNGVLKKAWIKEGNISYLYKAGSVIYHQEPLSEVLASMMLEKLQIIPYVPYDLVIHGMQICSRCKNFIDENTEFVPASHIYKKEKRDLQVSHYDHLVRMCKSFDIEEKEVRHFIMAMITADMITCNSDRHLGNFGFLRDAETGKFIGFAPIFDSGDAYRGTKNAIKDKHTKLFEEQEEWAIKNTLKKMDKSKNINIQDMIDLTTNYPTLEDYQQKSIIKQIKTINNYTKAKGLDEYIM